MWQYCEPVKIDQNVEDEPAGGGGLGDGGGGDAAPAGVVVAQMIQPP